MVFASFEFAFPKMTQGSFIFEGVYNVMKTCFSDIAKHWFPNGFHVFEGRENASRNTDNPNGFLAFLDIYYLEQSNYNECYDYYLLHGCYDADIWYYVAKATS